jgi:hypothetical protein
MDLSRNEQILLNQENESGHKEVINNEDRLTYSELKSTKMSERKDNKMFIKVDQNE